MRQVVKSFIASQVQLEARGEIVINKGRVNNKKWCCLRLRSARSFAAASPVLSINLKFLEFSPDICARHP